MAVMHPRIHWGSREVDWTWVPASTAEYVSVARRSLTEMLGVMAFVFLAGSAILAENLTNGGLGLLGMAAATGLAYALIVFAFYPVSGGHINPAITIGELFAQRIPPVIALFYLVAQGAGAVLGALLLELIYRDFIGDASGAASLAFNGDMTGWIGALYEGILTFILVVAYFRGFVDKRGNAWAGTLAVGLVVMTSFLVAFTLTGGAINVARVFGTALVANEWTSFHWYALAGFIGGGMAGLTYEYLFAARDEEYAADQAKARTTK